VVDCHGPDPGEVLGEVGEVVLAGLGVEQVGPRDVRASEVEGAEPLDAAGRGQEEAAVGVLLLVDRLQQVEQRVVASGGEQGALGARRGGAVLPEGGPRVALEPLVDEVLEEDPLPGHPGRGDLPRLHEGVHLLLVDVQVLGDLFRAHHRTGHGALLGCAGIFPRRRIAVNENSF
jgi:hypothetical protein